MVNKISPEASEQNLAFTKKEGILLRVIIDVVMHHRDHEKQN
jgi:hypothetical protein